MSAAVANPFQNSVTAITTVNSFHPSAQQSAGKYVNMELDVEKRIQALVAKDRIRIKEFFIDFDKLRKGVVTEAAFRTSLGTLNVSLNAEEINQLIAKYGQSNGLVCYANFCANVDHVFSDSADIRSAIDNSKSTAKFTAEEASCLASLLEAIRGQIRDQRILIKPQFQDYDKSKSCHITAEQFRRVLKELKLIPPTEELYQILIRKYFDMGNIREINYVMFCQDIDRPSDLNAPYVPKMPNTEKPIMHGQLRDAGCTFYNGSTANMDLISNRFQQQRIETFNDPSDVEKRLQAAVVMKRVRIEEFFTDFDKLRRGKIHHSQFKSILSMMNFVLNKEESESLCAKYNTADNMFNYKDFCACINAAFTTYGIQKVPQATVNPVTIDQTVPARKRYLEMSAEDQKCVQDILNEYSKAVMIRRVPLKQMFQDFDITRNQHVTKHQFMRILAGCHMQTSDNVMNVLLKTYCDRGNADEVNYYDFCNDVDSPEQLFGVGRGYNHSFDYYPKNRPRPTGNDIKKDMPNDVEDVLAKLRQFCKEQRLRISEFFRDFDKLRSGFITQAQFRIGLNMAKIVLSGNEFKCLTEQFCGNTPNQVRYKEFCDSVDEVFAKKHLEKNIDLVLDDARTESFYGQSEPNDQDRMNVQNVQERFKEQLIRERLDAKSFFKDHDRLSHFKVTGKLFKQILNLLKVPIEDHEVESIVKFYGNKQRDVEYLRFLDDCSVLHYTINEPYTGVKSTYRNKDTNFSGDSEVEAIMRKIRELVKRHRIRLGEFFLDHDPLRKGCVEATKFRTTLYAQKLQLTTEEYQILENHFRDQENPTKIRYADFNNDLENIFTEKDLEKCPTKTLSEFRVSSILEARNTLAGQDEKDLEITMCRIGRDVRNRRLLVKPFFQDVDKSNSGFIVNTRFRSIFDNQKLWITDREYFLINKRFQAKAANEINYVEFDHVLRHYSGDRE